MLNDDDKNYQVNFNELLYNGNIMNFNITQTVVDDMGCSQLNPFIRF